MYMSELIYDLLVSADGISTSEDIIRTGREDEILHTVTGWPITSKLNYLCCNILLLSCQC